MFLMSDLRFGDDDPLQWPQSLQRTVAETQGVFLELVALLDFLDVYNQSLTGNAHHHVALLGPSVDLPGTTLFVTHSTKQGSVFGSYSLTLNSIPYVSSL